MALKLNSVGGGSVTIADPASTASNFTLTPPLRSATLIGDDGAGKIRKADMPAGTVLQVVSTTKTDTFSTASTTFVDVTGYSATITPISATSKILVICNITATAIGGTFSVHGRLLRGSTPIAVGDAAGSRTQASYMWEGAGESNFGISTTSLDAPATTSPITYKMQIRTNNGAYTTYVNRATSDSDIAAYARTASTITVMEIAA